MESPIHLWVRLSVANAMNTASGSSGATTVYFFPQHQEASSMEPPPATIFLRPSWRTNPLIANYQPICRHIQRTQNFQ
ncbi:MAG TPA: hypothetical protein VK203_23765 [Nostocaceae cyanobacterium]|nr:hypothetical protein [Nostocaceae cyanobacterium]